MLLRERLRTLPKAELHVHLDGSIRPATMLELATRAGIPLPADQPAALSTAMKAGESGNLVEYLEKFATTLSLLQTPEALARAAFELLEDSAREGTWYVEVRYSPILHTQGGMSLEEAVDAPLRGLALAEEAFRIKTGLIVCGIRSMDPSTSLELARLALAYKNRGVVAFDLAGAEAGNPAREHRTAFQHAADGNLPITVHAGEADGPGSIAQALHECHARRIGHGTRLEEDPELTEFVRDFRIPLEVCLTSNVQTGVTPTLRNHPLRRYFDAGLVVTLNTDSRLISGTTLTEEYWLAHEHLGFGWEELKEISLMGFQAAFLPHDKKLELLERARGEMAGL
ncbi:adenosine deaminase [Gemmatimonadota bacterium]